jgi:drug/metabolite transporter (DMT)-like permease
MVTIGAAVALLSAITQAVAHALLKAGHDKLVVRGLIGLVGVVVMGPVTAFVPPPDGVLGWLAVSAALHAVYQVVLIQAYEAADFSLAYPLARGITPIATAVLGVWLLGDRLSFTTAIGIGVTTAGFVLLVAGARPRRGGVVAALAAGLLTSTYTWVDAQGVRAAPSPLTFIAWFFVCDGVVMSALALAARGRRIVALVRDEGRKGVLAGLASLLTYGSALVALRLLPTGAASALRETSVVFGVVLARGVLREAVSPRRAVGAALIACGALLVLLGLRR